MNFIKSFFKRKLKTSKKIEFQENLELRLLVEIALSDGQYSDIENAMILDRAKEIVGESRAEAMVESIKHNAKISTSLHPTINEVNNSFNQDTKILLLKHLWKLIASDSVVHIYEESLYFKIAELIKVKRSAANRIKVENS